MIQIKKNALKKDKKLLILIFIFFFTIYFNTSGGHVDPYDGIYTFLITENFVLNGTPALTKDLPSAELLGADMEQHLRFMVWNMAYKTYFETFPVGSDENPIGTPTPHRDKWIESFMINGTKGEFYGPTYLVLPTIAVPLYVLSSWLNISEINFVPLLLNPIIIATSCLVIFLLGKEIFKSEKTGFVLSVLFGLTSFIWPYITSMYARPLAILFIILSIYFILKYRRKNSKFFSIFAGLCIGFSILTHPLVLILTPGLLVFGFWELRKNMKKLLLLIIGFLMVISIQFYINDFRFGSIFAFGFGGADDVSGRASNLASAIFDVGDIFSSGFFGYLFSPGLSIFIYLPVFVLTPIGLYYLFKQDKSLAILLFYLIGISFGMMSLSDNWYINTHWGPHRYLLPIIPGVILAIGSLVSEFGNTFRLKIGLSLLAISGFIVNLLGNLVWIQYAFAHGWGPGGLWKVQDKDAVFAFNPLFSQPIQIIKVLAVDWVGQMKVNPESMDYTKIGLHGCSIDFFIYCNFGIITTIIIILITIVSLFFIIKKLISQKSDKIRV